MQKTPEQVDNDLWLKRVKTATAMATNIKPSKLYIVWFAKVLGNVKALVSTDVVNGQYYEVTFNGAKDEFYVDIYHKSSNQALPLENVDDILSARSTN